jgi:hypothetical protein
MGLYRSWRLEAAVAPWMIRSTNAGKVLLGFLRFVMLNRHLPPEQEGEQTQQSLQAWTHREKA